MSINNRYKIAFFLSFLTVIFFPCYAAKLQTVELRQQQGKNALYFKTDVPVHPKVFTLTNPNRIVIDLEKTELAFKLNQLKLNNKLVKSIRSGKPNANTLRIVLEVSNVVMPRPITSPVSPKTNYMFALDMAANHLAIVTKPELNKTKAAPVKPLLLPKRDVIVVIDAGHGGKDPGAMGPHRTLEKNITLAIAERLKQCIDKEPGMRAVLTRKGDYYVGLRERLNIARKYNGDVFVSIHADAFINQESNGASVFALSQRGATSEAARWLAEKENYSELGGVNLKNLDDQSGLVRTVLIDLSQTATIGASLHMGEQVLRNLTNITRLHNNKVEQARFMVLKSPDIPSILIETGFISNPREEANLSSYRYQVRLTQSIFLGLKKYFWEYPPHGTMIEAQANQRIHVVRNGETYQSIAAKYQVSLQALTEANKAQGKIARLGQQLTIPA